jgi:hypothetical protein
LSDLLVLDAERILPALLASLVRLCAKADVGRLNVSLLTGSILIPYFRMAGFVPREGAPVVVHSRQIVNSQDRYPSKDWLLLPGDRES